jgi:thymidine kinase
MATHDKQTLPAVSAEMLEDVRAQLNQVDVIGIDEGQFFPDLVPFCEEQANLGRIVIVAALDGTYQRKSFGHVLELVPLAEEVIKISAVCMVCQGDAHFSKRISSESDVEVIGGADKYISVCRRCFHGPSHPNNHQKSTPIPGALATKEMNSAVKVNALTDLDKLDQMMDDRRPGMPSTGTSNTRLRSTGGPLRV